MNKYQKIALAEKELNVKMLASILERHPKHVSNVLAGKRRQYRSLLLRKKIAGILGRSEHYLWPNEKR